MTEERYPRSEERVNAAIHGFAALFAVVGLVALVVHAEEVGRAGSVPAVSIYGGALFFLFLFSALHHAVKRHQLKHVLLALDHCGIFLLIAGTYTPFCLLMPPGQVWVLLTVIWGLAAGGITVQVAAFLTGHSARYEKLAFVFFLAMGWIPILWVGDVVFSALPAGGLGLLIAGGVAYSVGVIFYAWKKIPFGHAVWHTFVVAGSAFHFFSVFYYVVPVAV